ncbi:hypothetical protein G6F50_015766 [Rhizopus delemar]|jgi:hypothetical protein|uniref:Uncharacterized protein n=1 Tax=Rhizopus delemar TaxID=936053 RepID=A0A9P7C391_9FUNG|nr:hypothetical protein G6F50_015766 [Rhizopus delemar]
MKHLTEDTIRAVLVAAIDKAPVDGVVQAISAATVSLIASDKSLDAYGKGESWQDAKAPAVPQPPYPPVTDECTVHAMRMSGNTFIRSLVAAWECADANNRKRIRTTWADEFRKFATVVHYCEMARQAELEGRN